MSYCQFVRGKGAGTVHEAYHDLEYGFPVSDDDALFERLILEINQAGLSWDTILKRRSSLRAAYSEFSVEAIARYDEHDRMRLLMDPGVIRNRLKVGAAIHNAGVVLKLRETHGSFHRWLESQRGLSKVEWVKLFKDTFRFTGGEIVGEFLMSIGILPGAHDEDCEVGKALARGQLGAAHGR